MCALDPTAPPVIFSAPLPTIGTVSRPTSLRAVSRHRLAASSSAQQFSILIGTSDTSAVAKALGLRGMLQSNWPVPAAFLKIENWRSRSLRIRERVATFGSFLSDARAVVHAISAIPLRPALHAAYLGSSMSSFISGPAVLPSTNCGKKRIVIAQSAGAHTSAGTFLQTWSRVRVTYSESL